MKDKNLIPKEWLNANAESWKIDYDHGDENILATALHLNFSELSYEEALYLVKQYLEID